MWGVSRYILGSEIFDYWWDTTGSMIEHYADGDLVIGLSLGMDRAMNVSRCVGTWSSFLAFVGIVLHDSSS